jgi:hypothetical protein
VVTKNRQIVRSLRQCTNCDREAALYVSSIRRGGATAFLRLAGSLEHLPVGIYIHGVTSTVVRRSELRF